MHEHTSAWAKLDGQRNCGLIEGAVRGNLEGRTKGHCHNLIVQSTGNKSMHDSCRGIFRQIFSNFGNTSKVKESRLSKRVDMFL